MIEIISERQHHCEVSHQLGFNIPNTGCGYSFECDENGNIDIESLNPDAQENYQRCLKGENERGEKIVPGEVRELHSNWIEPACGKCECGTTVELEGFTNTCEGCGEDYDSCGQNLAPREQWGIETGEHPADIARIH